MVVLGGLQGCDTPGFMKTEPLLFPGSAAVYLITARVACPAELLW